MIIILNKDFSEEDKYFKKIAGIGSVKRASTSDIIMNYNLLQAKADGVDINNKSDYAKYVLTNKNAVFDKSKVVKPLLAATATAGLSLMMKNHQISELKDKLGLNTPIKVGGGISGGGGGIW